MRASLGSPTTHALDAYRATGVSPGRTAHATIVGTGQGRPDRSVRYSVYGPPWAPPIVVLGGISADRHLCATPENPAPGWWLGVVGPGQCLDPGRYRLIGIDYLSLGLECSVPGTGEQARAVEAVLSAEHIERAFVVGASYGGMVALSFASAFPERTERIVVVAGAHRSHAMASAVRAVQRSVVRLGVAAGREREGMVLARALAMTTYRSAAEFETRFPATVGPEETLSEVESYLTARGEAYAARTGSEHFLALSSSIDGHRVDPATVHAPATVVSFDTDTLVPPWLAAELVSAFAGPTRHVEVGTLYGHDGFLKETTSVSREIASALRCEGGVR